MVASIMSLAGLVPAWVTLPRHPITAAPAKTLFPLCAVFENRNAMILIAGYTATIWGAVGLRQWVVVFLGFYAGDPARTDWSMLAVAAVINLRGVPAGLWGNQLAIRFGLRFTAIVVFVATAVVTALFGLAALLPFLLACAAALAVGFIAQGNFLNLTSGLLAVATPQYAGMTMALYSCIGFGGGFVGTVFFGFTLDRFGGTDQLGARVVSFGISGIVCLLGAGGTALLPRYVERRA